MFDRYNAPFLDEVMSQKKTIEFTYDPLDPTLPGSALSQEYDHIFTNGPYAGTYDWRPDLGRAGKAVPQ